MNGRALEREIYDCPKSWHGRDAHVSGITGETPNVTKYVPYSLVPRLWRPLKKSVLSMGYGDFGDGFL